MHTSHILGDHDIFSNSPSARLDVYDRRESVRGIVRSANGSVALLHLNAFATHKLPGGGVEEGEGLTEALVREILEETGCAIDHVHHFATITEYRNQSGLMQISHGFLANQVGPILPPSLSQTEQNQQVGLIWADGLDAAYALISKDQPDNYAGAFIKRRDMVFLELAMNHLKG